MGETEVLELKRELAEAQKKVCDERHKTIDDALRDFKGFQKSITAWLIGIMGTTILTLLVTLVNIVAKGK